MTSPALAAELYRQARAAELEQSPLAASLHRLRQVRLDQLLHRCCRQRSPLRRIVDRLAAAGRRHRRCLISAVCSLNPRRPRHDHPRTDFVGLTRGRDMEHVTNIAHLFDTVDWAGTRGELATAVTEYVNDTDAPTVIVQPDGDVVAGPSAMADAQRVSWDRVIESVTA